MIQPKDLYRKLDALLASINNGSSEKDFLYSVSAKLENSFAKDLYIQNGRLYVEEHDAFVLLKASRQALAVLDAEAAQLVLRNGSYIYNDAALHINEKVSLQREYTIPAAFTVRNASQRWIFVFDLKSGWVREEVEFCLNAVRSLLNFRLVSDAMSNDVKRAA
ncbi:hypothetical protein HUU05_19295, partial [candidate division KSB1 bacterium]|nr:hypothetical protein [candidate division KSB1 bacterium]